VQIDKYLTIIRHRIFDALFDIVFNVEDYIYIYTYIYPTLKRANMIYSMGENKHYRTTDTKKRENREILTKGLWRKEYSTERYRRSRRLFQWGDYDDQLPRNVLRLGVCIPDSCTVSDLRTALQKKLEKVFVPDVATVTVKADPILCTVSGDMYPFTTAFYVTR